jgi:hypothetical protein
MPSAVSRAHTVVNIEAFGIRRREIAKHKLGREFVARGLPEGANEIDGPVELGVIVRGGERVDQGHIERRLAAVAGDLEHVVFGRIHAARAQTRGTLDERS